MRDAHCLSVASRLRRRSSRSRNRGSERTTKPRNANVFTGLPSSREVGASVIALRADYSWLRGRTSAARAKSFGTPTLRCTHSTRAWRLMCPFIAERETSSPVLVECCRTPPSEVRGFLARGLIKSGKPTGPIPRPILPGVAQYDGSAECGLLASSGGGPCLLQPQSLSVNPPKRTRVHA